MGAVAGIAILIALIGGHVAYGSWLTKGIRPRHFTTGLSVHEIRRIFDEKVARTGWKVVDDGNPMIAQSSLITGIRQQISLQTATDDAGRTTVVVGPQRWVTKWGVPKKGHTIRMRVNGFIASAKGSDPSIEPTLMPLRGR